MQVRERTTVQPVLLEVLSRVPADLFHCAHCERLFDLAGLVGTTVRDAVRAEYPSGVAAEAERLADWLVELSQCYGRQLCIRVVDAQSLERLLEAQMGGGLPAARRSG